ncbi:hypothetical protein Pan181_41510 [Aeoliella mucimassa]|uniref:Uncharacterized protein n=1 Tax=Aeoliella mucimassa TaxID=2527972 RepID=A0A518ARN8_9BACT|nr:hypothetical protein Pan181_35960 [Aeoliella mucimassa]QDU57928.1 hypothetical protein Pan181_41510 [Aeoliella mucimassa]
MFAFPTKASIEATPEADRKAKLVAIATAYQQEKNCRWSEACLEVKRRYGGVACDAFSAPAPKAFR